jgi:DNA-binding transcriptional ArsR family regulator
MAFRRDVFQAIADPTRRAIIQRISKEALSVNAIAENFDISRQAVSLQVKILAECGLVIIKQQGRERYCEARLKKLAEVSDWLEPYRRFYEATADSLENYLHQLQTKNKRDGKGKLKKR